MPLELSDLVPGTHLGHYVITDNIAQGGMGTVFKALEPALERYVAIKVLRPEYATNPKYVQYFQEEARAVAALRHPNIIPIFFIGQEGNVVFFSMAYIEGETFDDWIDTKRWFNEEQAKWFLSHAVAALHSAHKANIVHLDIKPANFLVDRANNIMLTDFGLAQKIVKDAGDMEREAFGTPAYVSPEQITRSPTDQRTDIYSLGATLFHMMTGKAPFNGTSVEDIVWGHLEKPFPIEIAREANLPTGWIHLLKKMMERSPEDRFANYRELRTALENVHSFRYETLPLEAPRAPKPVSIPRSGGNTQTIHGLLARTKSQWETAVTKTGGLSSIHITREQIDEAIKNLPEPLKVTSMANTLRDLCKSRVEDTESLMEVMERVPGYEAAVRSLVDFMINARDESESAAGWPAEEVLETLGVERASKLALTFFALNYEFHQSTHFDWMPLWRHQISVGIVIDFIYDALSLKRTGFEYATGLSHDIGKLIMAELFPYAYFTAINQSLQEEQPLIVCEKVMFSTDHAEIGSNWLKDQGLPHALVEAVALHEKPERIPPRLLLGHALVSANHLVKQIGIGYSGNCLLDARPWEELPSTGALWEARGNKDYVYDDFANDILDQFQNFPDLV
ncbi:MAG TPA: protein kinase [Candidatus Methylacidiphilales bacterium]|nr:protein kinase [Candidatus Methylacidiphilales bacterium]